jgi:hypothetical protein
MEMTVMGSDEHGPAYPDDGISTAWRHPDWKLRRDKRFFGNVMRRREELRQRNRVAVIGLTLAVVALSVVVLFGVLAAPAHGMDHGFDPNSPVTKWFEEQQRPDTPGSCCGKADAYPVDRYQKNADHTYTVWIADGRAIVYPDGSRRDPWDESVPITVPENKVNKEDDDLDNPTNHGWLFFRTSTPKDVGTIYCFIRHPQGN